MMVRFNIKKVSLNIPMPEWFFKKFIYPKRNKDFLKFMRSPEIQSKISELSEDLKHYEAIG